MSMNRFKTVILLAALSGLILLIGGWIGGQAGLTIALVLAVLMNFFSYFFSGKMVLAIYRAKPLAKSDAPGIHKIVEDLAKKAGIPKPKIYVIPTEAPNAFCTGRNPKNSVIAVTHGILKLLNKKELEGVLAHELSHAKNRDILISTIAATLAAVIMYVASMARFAAMFGGMRNNDNGPNILQILILAIIAPLAAMVIQLAISRSREFLADETSAKLTKEPQHLASALLKLEEYSKRIPLKFGNQATAHLFIVNPLTGRQMANFFSTHPSTKDRVERLNAMKS